MKILKKVCIMAMALVMFVMPLQSVSAACTSHCMSYTGTTSQSTLVNSSSVQVVRVYDNGYTEYLTKVTDTYKISYYDIVECTNVGCTYYYLNCKYTTSYTETYYI